MPPKESDSLLPNNNNNNNSNESSPPTTTNERVPTKSHLFLSRKSSSIGGDDDHINSYPCISPCRWWRLRGRGGRCAIRSAMIVATAALLLALAYCYLYYDWTWRSAGSAGAHQDHSARQQARTGPYQLTQRQVGAQFLDFYTFYEGPDSIGSAGYNTYTAKQRALDLGLIHVTTDEPQEDKTGESSSSSSSFVHLSSLPTAKGPRESIRLEGNQRFNAGGLFILDLDHMPAGCGQWPAFWLTDEDHWPDHGEIDIVEGVNYQSQAKTALHTADQCRMFAHVPDFAFSGHWDRATGLPDTFTGRMDWETNVPADNCWNMAPHQWANQGCVVVSAANDTLGPALNAQGGGIYALQWDPTTHVIRSWVFPKASGIPANLHDSLTTSSHWDDDRHCAVTPDPDTWGLPYAAFAIGEATGCSASHFQNMRLVLNTAFCGTVAGNRFFRDCPVQAQQFNVSNDPVLSCNAWIASRPDELNEAYWKIRGVYVYERAFQDVPANHTSSASEEDGQQA